MERSGNSSPRDSYPERDPLGIIARQNETRVPELVPLRAERMSASPFTFYRGTAAIMAADQGRAPHSGILVAACGDAHISNFGFYGSPQRTLVFDLNDFDESAWAPWEWDVQRLVTSVIIGGRATERHPEFVHQSARNTIEAYANALRHAAAKPALERYYNHYDPRETINHLDKASKKALRGAMKDAKKRTGDRAARRRTEIDADGKRRFIEEPPVLTALSADVRARMDEDYASYLSSVNVDIRMLLEQYTVDDGARRVVGVGSVGTRCYVAALQDRQGNPLILQVKQAGRSVLEEYGGIPQPHILGDLIANKGEGARVVSLQRILQAYSDPFLGHLQSPDGDFYVRQFHDMKGGLEVEDLEDVTFERFATACAVLLARAHAQSPRLAEVVGYIDGDPKITDSILSWCEAYTDTSLADYESFLASLS